MAIHPTVAASATTGAAKGSTTMQRPNLRRDRSGAVSVLFATAAVPLIGCLGLAIDFAFVTQARQQLVVAADTAVLSAIKTAANQFLSKDSDFQNEGQLNGRQWFTAQLGSLRGANNDAPGVVVSRNGVTFTGSVTYTGHIPAHFAQIFGFKNFNVTGVSTASIQLNAYVNNYLFLDNSGSMLIGASTSDVNLLQSITACSPESGNSQQGTSAWTGPQTPSGGCPTTISPPLGGSMVGTNYNPGLPVKGTIKAAACGFACHFSADNQKTTNGAQDLTQYDYYRLARCPSDSPSYNGSGSSNKTNPIGANCNGVGPQLRFDVVQDAAGVVVQQMINDEVLPQQFGLGVFEFNGALQQIYPTSGDSSTDLASGETAVNQITTPTVPNGGNTDFPDSLTSLTNLIGKGGDGSSTSSPRKNVFIVTDGLQDYAGRAVGDTMGPFSNSAAQAACTALKSNGVSIYILYTPYTALPFNPFYQSNINQFVASPPTPNQIVQALDACASSPNDVYEADIPAQIVAGLTQLLQAAINKPAQINS
jgi:Flp pilus assembly protein TadG